MPKSWTRPKGSTQIGVEEARTHYSDRLLGSEGKTCAWLLDSDHGVKEVRDRQSTNAVGADGAAIPSVWGQAILTS